MHHGTLYFLEVKTSNHFIFHVKLNLFIIEEVVTGKYVNNGHCFVPQDQCYNEFAYSRNLNLGELMVGIQPVVFRI